MDEDVGRVAVSETSELVRLYDTAQAEGLSPWFHPSVEFLDLVGLRKNSTFGQHHVPPVLLAQ